MRRLILAAVTAAMAFGMAAAAAKLDSRLATMRKVHIVPIDDLGADVAVVACLIDRISKGTPIAVVPREEAETILRVRANLPSATKKALVGVMGGSPSAHVYVDLPDGTKLWDDGAKYRRSMTTTGTIGAGGADVGESVECGLANGLIEKLRNVMRKARDENK